MFNEATGKNGWGGSGDGGRDLDGIEDVDAARDARPSFGALAPGELSAAGIRAIRRA
jgi:hypothetical protein